MVFLKRKPKLSKEANLQILRNREKLLQEKLRMKQERDKITRLERKLDEGSPRDRARKNAVKLGQRVARNLAENARLEQRKNPNDPFILSSYGVFPQGKIPQQRKKKKGKHRKRQRSKRNGSAQEDFFGFDFGF